MNEAFGLFAHVNVLQRDMCPSATKFEGEIIAMTLDLLHADAVTDGDAGRPRHHAAAPAASSTPMLAYREHAAPTRGVDAPERRSSPRPRTPRSTRPATSSASSCARAPVDPVTHAGRRRLGRATTSTTRPSPSSARPATTATAPIDPIAELVRRSRSSAASGCTSTAAWAASSCPFGQELGYDIPLFDFRVPGVTTISADTHKYGYALQGHVGARCSATRRCATRQYFYLTDWSGGKYCSPGMEGSRSGGLLAATWAAMVQLGREGYLRLRQGDLRDRRRHAGRGALAPRAAHHGQRRRSCFSLHLRRVRHLPRQRLHADRGAGASTASSTPTRSTWR